VDPGAEWCARYKDDEPEPGSETGAGLLAAWSEWGRMETNGGYTDTRFDVCQSGGLVTSARARDCLIAMVDTYECHER
jgi:hypothetical protein